jgi:hypothetical protein
MKSNSNSSKQSESELILRTVNLSTGSLNASDASNGRFSDRFDSFGSSNQRRSVSRLKVRAERCASPARGARVPRPRRNSSPAFSEQQPPPPPRPQPIGCTIPISDIVVADVHDAHVIFLTTLSNGYFEFCFHTANARDMMLAFLSASLGPERMLSQAAGGPPTEENVEDPACSFDVETLTANRIEERMRTESFSEKVRRKMAHVALQIEEISTSISECACGYGNHTTPKKETWNDDSRRQSPSPSPPRCLSATGHLEFSSHSVDEFNSPKKGGEDYMNLEPELENAR